MPDKYKSTLLGMLWDRCRYILVTKNSCLNGYICYKEYDTILGNFDNPKNTKGPKIYYILYIMTVEQNMGVGTRMLQKLIQTAKGDGATTLLAGVLDKPKAKAFFNKKGFLPITEDEVRGMGVEKTAIYENLTEGETLMGLDLTKKLQKDLKSKEKTDKKLKKSKSKDKKTAKKGKIVSIPAKKGAIDPDSVAKITLWNIPHTDSHVYKIKLNQKIWNLKKLIS